MPEETTSVGGATDDSLTLYRAVQDGELTDIVALGAYSTSLGTSVEGKYFFETAPNAARFAKKMYQILPREGPYTITLIGVSQAVIQTSDRLYVAGEGTVIFVPKSALPLGPVRILDYAPIP